MSSQVYGHTNVERSYFVVVWLPQVAIQLWQSAWADVGLLHNVSKNTAETEFEESKQAGSIVVPLLVKCWQNSGID